jgi:hypothetical protein
MNFHFPLMPRMFMAIHQEELAEALTLRLELAPQTSLRRVSCGLFVTLDGG